MAPTPRLSILITLAAIVGIAGFSSASWAQRVTLSTEGGDIYAGLPFVLQVSADGFDDAPEPKVADFKIDGASIDFLGVSPNVSTSISIINGRRSQSKRVTFVFRYRVTIDKAGTYTVPSVSVSQGTKQAASKQARFSARDIESTRDMRLEIVVPERPVWVGEAFEMNIDWLLRVDPGDQNFFIPIFDNEDQFRVVAAEIPGARTLGFSIGDRKVELPYERGETTIAGVKYQRLRFKAIVTPQRPGQVELPPATVVARLQTGYGRDSFGFRTARRKLFKAQSPARTLKVKPLPAQGRPDSFAGAVGTRFSIDAQASRTVVRVGDPIALTILVRGDGGLAGLKLPNLAGALDPKQFEVPEEMPPGESTDDGNGKRFQVTVRLRGTEAREIAELPFSYFDPHKATYVTVRTQPIALSIAGSNVVGAGDVITGRKKAPTGAGSANLATVIDADLSLSDTSSTLRTVLSVGSLTPVLAALYALPLLLLFGRLWQVKTRETRGASAELKRAQRKLGSELDKAKSAPARDSASSILSALRSVAALAGTKLNGPVVERLETEGYKPDADSAPLDPELIAEVRTLAAGLKTSSKNSNRAAAIATLLAALTLPAIALAQGLPEEIQISRQLYAQALETADRDIRAERFSAVAQTLTSLNDKYRDRPELLTDWGSAALGARDFGRAALAYRRALVLDPTLSRAQANLEWLRSNGPAHASPQAGASAADTLFFWHRRFTPAQKHLAIAVSFALALLLLTPWGTRRHGQRGLAAIPAAAALALLISVVIAESPAHAVVITDGAEVIRSADSAGAPPIQSTPPGAGAEALVSEDRDGWVRLRFADGTAGWMRTSAIEYVVPR